MKDMCPICDGKGKNHVDKKDVICWACKGSGKVKYGSETNITEVEIKMMFSALGQR